MLHLAEILIALSVVIQGIDGQTYTVTIASNPAGTPVSGSTNIFRYPILSSVTLTCMVTLSGTDVSGSASFRWDTTGCYTNNAYNGGRPRCFPNGRTTQTVTGNDLLAEDAGTITCIATISGVAYTSDPMTIRISGVAITGGVDTTRSNAVTASNIINDYSHAFAIDPNDADLFFRCVTGLGPTGGNNAETSSLYFNNVRIPNGGCDGPVVQARGATIGNFVGVINVFLCRQFTINQEGVYRCTMRNSDLVDESVRVGVYLLGRTAPVITTAILSTVNVVIGAPLTLSCTSEGSPPDTFTWMKDGVPITQSNSFSMVTHTNTIAVFRSEYTISGVSTSDSGIYTCTVTNPIGSDSYSITVNTANSTGVTIVSNPAGAPVDDQPNTFNYPLLSSVTLTCMVEGLLLTGPASYRWDTTGCYTNTAYNSGNPNCFPNGQTTQTVTGTDLLAENAGTIYCTVTIGDVHYYSTPLIIRISGIRLIGGVDTTGSNDVTASNIINNDYVTAIDPNDADLLFRCVTGLGPTSNNNAETSSLHFNNELIPHGGCDGPVVQSRGATISNFVGVTNVFLCSSFTARQEGVYRCTMRSSDMVDESLTVGVYLPGRTAPIITAGTPPTVNAAFGTPLTLYCTSEGSPPDTFTWMKDGVPITQSTSITTVTHTSTSAVFRTIYFIGSASTSDSGTYTCTVTNPIGSDSYSITVNATNSTGVVIVSNPAGTPVDGQLNTVSYPILSSVSLTCMLVNGVTEAATYQWDTTGCYTNTAYNRGNPNCFPVGETAQTVTGIDLNAEDAGTIHCTITIGDVHYTSSPLTLHISGVTLTGGVDTTGSNDVTASNIINDYSAATAIDPNDADLLFRCVTGLGPNSNNNAETSSLYFNDELIPHGGCNDPVVQSRGATISNFVGVINVFLCSSFTARQEGIYTCTMRNSDMVDQSARVGVYLPGRSAPVITTATSSIVNIVIGAPLTLYCTSEGSPPDTFTWMKDGVSVAQSSSVTTVNHNSTSAVFRSVYTISSATTSDSGTYTCTVTNPIGSDTHVITVIAVTGVTIVSDPAGTPVNDQPNTFDYPVLGSVNLTCMVTLANGDLIPGLTTYRWDTTGCYTNTAYNSGNPKCFPNGQTTQTITGNDLTAEDAGIIYCIATVNGIEYTSSPLTIRISGVRLTGSVDNTGSNEITSDNIIENYSYIRTSDTVTDVLFRCVTGLGPTGSNNAERSALHFNNQLIPHGGCDGPVVQSRGADITQFVGVINVGLCGNFTTNEEGVYTCVTRNRDGLDESVRVGVYLPGRTAPTISNSTTPSTVNAFVHFPLTLSCTSEGSPPDTFTWKKDGVPITQSTSITTVTHSSTRAVFYTEYSISEAATSDSGTYTCSVTNPIGSDSHSVTVNVVPIPPLSLTVESVEETTIILSWTTPSVPATILYYQIDYSDQDNTLSVISRNTDITLTNLVSGINYFINVAAFTDTGEIATNSISVTTINTAFFQIRLRPVSSCAQWIEIDERQKLEDIKLELKQAISPICGCIFDIDNELFSCPESKGKIDDAVVFKARIVVRVPASVTDADDVVNYINDWVKLRQNITVTPSILTVDPGCPTQVDSTESKACVDIGQSTNSDSSDGGVIAGAIIAGVFVVIAILIIVVMIGIICIQRRRSRVWHNNDYCEFTANSAVIPESKDYEQSNPIYTEIKNDRTQATSYYSDYRQPKDFLQVEHTTKDDCASITEKDPADSEAHFT